MAQTYTDSEIIMSDNNQYWKQLISMGIRLLQDQKNDVAVVVMKKASFDIEHSFHDSWNGGVDYWEVVFNLKYKDYMALGEEKEQVERDIMTALLTV